MKWFKHDANAHVDAKIERLLERHGLEGYGLYFYCLELIARNVEKHNLSFELEHDARIIARRLYMSADQVQGMMTYMVELGLFENDRGVITCLKMASRADEYTGKLMKHASTITTLSIQNQESIGTKSELIEEKKIEEKRKTIKPRFVPPTIDEVRGYAKSKGWVIDAEKFHAHYDMKGWMVGRNKMKKWKSAVTASREWTEKKGHGGNSGFSRAAI